MAVVLASGSAVQSRDDESRGDHHDGAVRCAARRCHSSVLPTMRLNADPPAVRSTPCISEHSDCMTDGPRAVGPHQCGSIAALRAERHGHSRHGVASIKSLQLYTARGTPPTRGVTGSVYDCGWQHINPSPWTTASIAGAARFKASAVSRLRLLPVLAVAARPPPRAARPVGTLSSGLSARRANK